MAMQFGHHRARRILSSNVPSPETVCAACRRRLASTATAAAAAPESTGPSSISGQDRGHPPVVASGPRKAFRVMCSPVVSRAPLLTRALTPFEQAFYLYQKRLNERLALPFTKYFYFKKGTPADTLWKRRVKERRTAARDIGHYNAYADDGWNDEVLVGSTLGENRDIMEKLWRDAAEGGETAEGGRLGDPETAGEEVAGAARPSEGVTKPVGEPELERPLPRLTRADHQDDRQSLDRKLDRSLYLLVRSHEGRWNFPQDRVFGRESLHMAAERILIQLGGINMNTWVVGNHPIGHCALNFRTPAVSKIAPNRLVPSSQDEFEQEEYGEKIFFMKTRIMGGQADLSKNEYSDQAFEWLTKEEVQEKVSPQYWRSIKGMLTER